MKGKMAIMTAIALTVVIVGVAFGTTQVTQHFPPLQRRIQITAFCDTLVVSPNTPIPDVGSEGVIRLQCPGSASNPLCSNWSSGLDCAFYAGDSTGGGRGFAIPTFDPPAGYLHIWQKGPGVFPTNLTEEQDCSQFDDPGHWLTSGTPSLVGNISGVYCAHLDPSFAVNGDVPGFDLTWS